MLRAHFRGILPPIIVAIPARYRLIATLIGVELVVSSLLRLVLVAVYRDGATLGDAPVILAGGVVFDLLAAITAFLPLLAIVYMFR